MAKEALFNILNNEFEFADIRVLDLFGGTGSHTYEFCSRGCEDVTYVDKFGDAIKFVRKTTQELGIQEVVKIFQMDVFRFLGSATGQWDYIFAGPPYALPTIDTIPTVIFEKNLVADGGLFVLEHNPNHDFIDHPNCVDVRKYGKTLLSFFRPVGTTDL